MEFDLFMLQARKGCMISKRRVKIAFQIVFTACTVVLTGAITCKVWLFSEPVYDDRTLTDWLSQYADNTYFAYHPSPTTIDLRNVSKSAILNIGSDAVPTLLQMARAHDTPFAVQCKSYVDKFLPDRITHRTTRLTANDFHMLAVSGFELLGTSAKSAIPQLILLLDSQYADVRLAGLYCLHNIGPLTSESIPYVIRCLSDTNIRADAIYVLGKSNSDSKLLIPALQKYLGDDDINVRIAATNSLNAIQQKAHDEHTSSEKVKACPL